MGRGRARSSSGSRPSAPRQQTSYSRPAQPAPAAQARAAPAAAPQAAPAPASGGFGGGGLGSMLGQGMALGAGSAVGHAVVGSMFGGGGGGHHSQPAPEQAAPAQQYQQHPCEAKNEVFQRCLNEYVALLCLCLLFLLPSFVRIHTRSSNGDIASCQHLYDEVRQCKNAYNIS